MHIALCGGRRGSYKVVVSSVFVWIDDGVWCFRPAGSKSRLLGLFPKCENAVETSYS